MMYNLMTVQEVADYLGYTAMNINKLCRDGKMEFEQIRGFRYFDREYIKTYPKKCHKSVKSYKSKNKNPKPDYDLMIAKIDDVNNCFDCLLKSALVSGNDTKADDIAIIMVDIQRLKEKIKEFRSEL